MEENNKKQAVEMTAEEMAQFAAYKAEKERQERLQRRRDNREAYAEIVDEQVGHAVETLQRLSSYMEEVKASVTESFKEVLAMKTEVMGFKQEGQHSHTFTTSDGQMRITLGVHTIDSYRDTVEDGIGMVKQYIESMAKDENSRVLVNGVMRLLSRDQKGTLKASRVLQLRKMAEETGDETFIEGVRIIEESYQPTETKTYIRAEVKGCDGAWLSIPLSLTDV